LCDGFHHFALAHLQPIRKAAVARPRISVVAIDEVQNSAKYAHGISADYTAVIGMQSKRLASLMEEVPPRHRRSRTAEGGAGGNLRGRIDAPLCAQTPQLKARVPSIILRAADDRAHSDGAGHFFAEGLPLPSHDPGVVLGRAGVSDTKELTTSGPCTPPFKTPLIPARVVAYGHAAFDQRRMIVWLHKTESIYVAAALGFVAIEALTIIQHALAFREALRVLGFELGFDFLDAKLRADHPDLCRLDYRQLVERRVEERAAVVSPAIGRAGVGVNCWGHDSLPIIGEHLDDAPRCLAGNIPILMVQAVFGAEESLDAALTHARWRGVDLR
jgi:hypothetical protein